MERMDSIWQEWLTCTKQNHVIRDKIRPMDAEEKVWYEVKRFAEDRDTRRKMTHEPCVTEDSTWVIVE